MKNKRIVFMGTPEFAVPALTHLYHSGFHIVGVYSQPPRPQGRGYRLVPSPVQVCAEKFSLPVFSPASLKAEPVQEELKNLQPDFIVVVAYGLILPPAVLSVPRFCCMNIHPSLLPRWRGAAPLQRTLLHGDTHTAITLIRMDAGLDTGDILSQKKIPVPPLADMKDFSAHMSEEGALLLIKTLNNYPHIIPIPQSEDGVLMAPRIQREEGIIHWEKTAQELDQQIRAFCLWPTSWFVWKGKRIKILKAKVVSTPGVAGVVCDASSFIVGCGGKDSLQLLSLLPDGGRPLSAKDFLNGYGVSTGESLS